MPTNAETLDIILGTPAYYRQLYAFAVGDFTTENLDFLDAAAMYRRNPSKTRAIEIIDRFVKAGAEFQVNVSGAQRESVVTATEGYAASRGRAQQMGFFKRHWTAGHRKAAENVFDDAVREIRKVVAQDTLSRFLKSTAGAPIKLAIEQRAARPGAIRAALLDRGIA